MQQKSQAKKGGRCLRRSMNHKEKRTRYHARSPEVANKKLRQERHLRQIEKFRVRRERWKNNILYSLRKARKWTQDQLADRLGKSRDVVSRYENKRQAPTQSVISALAKIFKIKESQLCGRPS